MILKRLRELREEKKLTQQDVAEILNTTFQNYYRYEKGVRDLPLKHLMTLCEFYNVSADYILGFTDECKPLK